jgi:hypothetical protein
MMVRLAPSFAWYLDTFMLAVQSKDVEKMKGIFEACMLVLESIVEHDSTVICQSMFMSFLVETKEHFSASLFSNFRVQALKLSRFLSWLIKEALSRSFHAKQFLEHLLECVTPTNEVDVLFFQTCVVLSVEIMAISDRGSLDHEGIEEMVKSTSSLPSKLVILKTIFNALVQYQEMSSPHQIDFAALGISRESSLKSLDCIVKHLTENAALVSQSERTASTFFNRETAPTFSLYGEIIEFLSKALKVYCHFHLNGHTFMKWYNQQHC